MKTEIIQPEDLAEQVVLLMSHLIAWKPHIMRAMEKTSAPYSFDEIVTSVLTNGRQVYAFDGCLVIMQLDEYARHKVYHCFLACGDMEAIIAAEPQLTEIALALGCTHLSISGRTGWPRALKDHGWEHTISTLQKEIV